MTINVYDVPPFSGKRFSENESNLTADESPCAICGKAVNYPFKHSAIVIDGGAEWAKTQEECDNTSDPGHMGMFGIGPDCHRKHLVKQ